MKNFSLQGFTLLLGIYHRLAWHFFVWIFVMIFLSPVYTICEAEQRCPRSVCVWQTVDEDNLKTDTN